MQTASLMTELRGRGHDVLFLGSCPVLLHLCHERGIPTIAAEIGEPPVTKTGCLSFVWRKRAMKDELHRHMKDIGSIDAIFMISLSEKLLLTDTFGDETKIFWIEHDPIGRWLTLNPWLPALRRLGRHAVTVCVSELSRALYLNLGWSDTRTVAIANGIDPDRFKRKDRAPANESPRIGCIARLAREKGVEVLVRATAQLPDAHLTIVGKGPQDAAIRNLVRSLGMTDRAELWREHDDLEAWYGSIDALVLPSISNDPFGLVAAEAMMLGIPTIVTDACGIAGYVHDGKDALICKAGSAPALTSAICRVIDDQSFAKTLGENGKRTAERSFAASVMTDAYERLLHDDINTMTYTERAS